MRLAAIVLLATALLVAGCGEPVERQAAGEHRLIALAPNVAEILFELDLGDRVVGVSRFTAYPPEAASRPSVGGTYDPHYERIVALRPTLAIGLETQQDIASHLHTLGIPFLGVAHERIDEILDSILQIGRACGVEESAQRLVRRLEARMEELAATAALPAAGPRVLVCVGHDETGSRMYVAAKNTLYDDLIERAGAINACETTIQKYPEISREGLLSMRPDRIVVIAPGQPAPLPAQWPAIPTVVLTNDYTSIPGPRFIQTLETLQRILSGETAAK